MIFLENSKEYNQVLNEMNVNILPGLPVSVENSVLYAKLKNLLHGEIISFTKEKFELKEDLNILRLSVGEQLSEDFIRSYMEDLKKKYNEDESDRIGMEFHIEQTRYDFAVILFVVIQRDQVFCKKFVFRFRKASTTNLADVSLAGVVIKEEKKNEPETKFDQVFGMFRKKK